MRWSRRWPLVDMLRAAIWFRRGGKPLDQAAESAAPSRSPDSVRSQTARFERDAREAPACPAGEELPREDLNAMLVNLSRRNQSLIDRQLSLIDSLEQSEQDPGRLSSLFRLDYLATRMLRNSENLLVLADHEVTRRWSQPIPLVDVLRAAGSEIEQYERVVLNVQPGIVVVGEAVNDVVHMVAEIVENATTFSPEDTPVHVSGQPLSSGGVLLDITDDGVGISDQEMLQANWRLDNPPAMDVAVSHHMGLFVVGRLAARHGVRVRLRHAHAGGLTALIWLPETVAAPEVAPPVGRLHRFEADDYGPALSSLSAPERVPGSADSQPAAAARIPRFSSSGSPSSPSSTPTGPLARAGGAAGTDLPLIGAAAGSPAAAFGDETVTGQGPVMRPPIAGDQRLPVFDSLESDWFGRRGRTMGAASGAQETAPQATSTWTSPADEGWRVAQAASAPPPPGEITPAGLPRRVPQANLIPGSVTGGTGQEADGTVSAALARTAEDVRSRMSSFQRGVREARSRSADETPLRENLRVVADDRSNEPPRPAKALAVAPARQHWLVADMPTAVPVHEDVSLLVKVGTGPSGTGSGSIPLRDFETGPGGTRVTVIVQAPRELSPAGPLEQVLVVPETGDSDPVRFAFRAEQAGLVGIRVAAFAGGTFLGELVAELSVEAGGRLIGGPARTAAMEPVRAVPGEVTLQVRFDGERYTFQLLSEPYLFEPVIAQALTAQPGAAVERAVATLRAMANASSGYTEKNARTWMEQTGIGLWNDMVPDLIKEQFWQLRSSIGTFSIACGQDTIPWELLYPLSLGQDEGFLVEQFPVLRRVYGQRRSRRVSVTPSVYVVPAGSPANASQEIDALRHRLGASSEEVCDLDRLLDLISTGTGGLLHFACHSTFRADAGGSSITMGGGPFVPELLNRAVTNRSLAVTNPLVFINACRSAGEVPEYTRLMGWASQFMAAGAGAFAGTLWAVRSATACAFAEAFYDALLAGQALGHAARTARKATAADAADPTWLAYAVYGDPEATATVATAPSAAP